MFFSSRFNMRVNLYYMYEQNPTSTVFLVTNSVFGLCVLMWTNVCIPCVDAFSGYCCSHKVKLHRLVHDSSATWGNIIFIWWGTFFWSRYVSFSYLVSFLNGPTTLKQLFLQRNGRRYGVSMRACWAHFGVIMAVIHLTNRYMPNLVHAMYTCFLTCQEILSMVTL